jgi:F-type H+-transporting ATPase subunit gamma
MKMVAAAKLRRAQTAAEAARPYARRMAEMMAALASGATKDLSAPALLVGTGKDQVHLLVAITSDRGLAGAFNASIARAVRQKAIDLQAQGKTVKILSVGRKGQDFFRRELASQLVGHFGFANRRGVEFAEAGAVADKLVQMFHAGEFDVATLVSNHFVSVITQRVVELPLIPPAPSSANDNDPNRVFEVEPDDGTLLDRLLPRNLAIQIYSAMLENSVGFYASQMTAMDSATRNAGEMIKRLTLNYNRARQANITKELIEIISGAEAL